MRKTRAADPAGMPPKKKTARRRSLKESYRVLSRDQGKKKVGEAQKLGANPRDKKKGDALVKEIGNLRRPQDQDQPKQPPKVHPSIKTKRYLPPKSRGSRNRHHGAASDAPYCFGCRSRGIPKVSQSRREQWRIMHVFCIGMTYLVLTRWTATVQRRSTASPFCFQIFHSAS